MDIIKLSMLIKRKYNNYKRKFVYVAFVKIVGNTSMSTSMRLIKNHPISL